MSAPLGCPFGQECPPDQQRQITRLSFGVFKQLRKLSDELFDVGSDYADALSAEVDEIVRRGSHGMCTDCGSYDGCNCDAMADQQETGGY